MVRKVIFLCDMQSFYASVEKADDPGLKGRPVLVSGDPKRRSGIILAACPLAKKFGVQTAETLGEAQNKCPHAIVKRPRMQRYIEVSYQITNILERFTDLVEVFSIDEQFLDVTYSRRLFGDPLTIAKKVQQAVQAETGIPVRIGIGPNKVLAKMACDQFAKKNKTGIFLLNEKNMKEKLWPLPVGKMFGVGRRMENHLGHMGIRTIGQLAGAPCWRLKKRWGVNGEWLWRLANGIDPSPVCPATHEQQKAVGHHMTLPRDYETAAELKVVLLELSEEVARRAREKGYRGRTVSLGVRGSDLAIPSGFYRQLTLEHPTNFGMDIFYGVLRLFYNNWNGFPVRSVGIALSHLMPSYPYQLSFFDASSKKEQLSQAMDQICRKYGRTALIRASSLTEAGQIFDRAKKIGGHYK